MNILAFSNDTGSVRWRLQNIASYLNARTDHEMFVTSHANWNGDTLGADIVIAQMWQNPKGVLECKKQGAKVVYEADDIIIGVGGKDRKKLMALTPEQEQLTKETIAACDLVTVTTEVLASHYRQFNTNVVVLPNYMDFRWWGEPPKIKNYGGQIRIGWAGSYSHREDLLMIKPVVKKILEEYPFVKFVYCGYGGMTGLGKAISFGEDVFSEIPVTRREFYPGVPVDYWNMKSKTLGFDIAIAPLLDDEFNSGKSPLKFMEYSANRMPGVYSDTVVYRGTVEHGKTGYLAKNEDEWFTNLSRLILETETRNTLAQNALETVFKQYNLEDHYMKWVEAYGRLL